MSVISDLLFDSARAVAADSERRPFDAVVVGGGPTGATAARTLVEAGHRVALLEAGPYVLPTHANSTDLRFVDGAVRRLQNELSYSPRHESGEDFGALVAALGGRGLFWNGAAPRFRDSDFDGWPIGAADLAEDYTWAERELFVSSRWGSSTLASKLSERLKARGIDARPEPFAVDARDTIDTWLGGTIGNPLSILLRSRVSVAAGAESQLRVVPGAYVSHVQFSDESVRAVVRDASAAEGIRVAARAVVLGAGGYGSVRLAIASGLPDASAMVGRGLADHWFVRGYFPLPPQTYVGSGPQAAALIIDPAEGRPYQLEIHVPARRFFHARSDGSWMPDESETYAAMIRAFAPTQSADGWLEVGGDGRGEYTVHLPTTDADRELIAQMRRGLDEAREALGAQPAEIEVYPLGASYHEAGGLRMSATEQDGVINVWGRVWGDERVCVVDASAFPSIGCTNPHLTLVAVARRQSRALAERLSNTAVGD